MHNTVLVSAVQIRACLKSEESLCQKENQGINSWLLFLIPLTLILILLFHRKRLRKLETISPKSKRNSGEKGGEGCSGQEDLQPAQCSLFHACFTASFFERNFSNCEMRVGLCPQLDPDLWFGYYGGGWAMITDPFLLFPATLRGFLRCP